MKNQATNKQKGKLLALELKKELADDKVKIARNILYTVGGLSALSTLSFIDSMEGMIGMGISIFILILGYMTTKTPRAATVIGAALMSLLYGVQFLEDYLSDNIPFYPTVIKAAICILLYVSVYNAFQAAKTMEEYNRMKSELL